MKFNLDDDELASCVSCGLCLAHCPTYRVTGEEALSPRGRIATMRAVERDGAAVTAEVVDQLTSCVQCRGCEPACPSGVPYGHLIEGAREALTQHRRTTPLWQRMAYAILGHHRLLLTGSTMLAVAQRAHLVPRRLGVGTLALRRPPALRGDGADAWLMVGCVMDAWQRHTHHATARVLEAVGVAWATPEVGGCCGALHVHAGLTQSAKRLATRLMAGMPGTAPVVVNSAGCGAQLKDLGRLLGTDEARAFSDRVVDVHEFVARRLDRLPAPRRHLGPVMVQDPCHLRHVQKSHLAVRTVLSRVADVVELDDDGLCCGAGGAYAALEPGLAGHIRDRKVEVIMGAAARSGARVVASANPGCALHLQHVGLEVRHPMDLVAEALS
jgi:glycolate oxidase iron-sulfur subunit